MLFGQENPGRSHAGVAASPAPCRVRPRATAGASRITIAANHARIRSCYRGAALAVERLMRFANRADAGRQLAAVLRSRCPADPVVIGIVRGGVPVAAEIARSLQAPLDICVVRSVIGRAAPRVVIGAVAEHGAMYLDPAKISRLALGDDECERLVAQQMAEVDRLSTVLRDGPPIDLRGRNVILVDDAVVSGATVRAAIRSIRRTARSVDLAVPVAETEVIERIRPFVDRLHCLIKAPLLSAAGARFDSFDAVSEAEIANMLARRRPAIERQLHAR